jgi:hypothetical protein
MSWRSLHYSMLDRASTGANGVRYGAMQLGGWIKQLTGWELLDHVNRDLAIIVAAAVLFVSPVVVGGHHDQRRY